jgi:hypothetical protein
MATRVTPGGATFTRLLGRGFEWTLLALLFGLLQLWLDIGSRLGSHDLSFFSVIKDGAVLFFVTGIVSGIAIDFQMDQKKNAVSNVLKRWMFFVIPFVVLILAIIAYQMTKQGIDASREDYYIAINVWLSILSIVYSIGAKAYLYKD